MEKVVVIIVVGLVSITVARPQGGFDDEGEMSVPRSPKILGPSSVGLNYSNRGHIENLRCQIEGSPTPTVIWLKDGQEIRNSDLYNTTYNVGDGKSELAFSNTSYTDEKKNIEGNFTCIAANFLGRAQKLFLITITVDEQTNITTTTTAVYSSETSSTSTPTTVQTSVSTNGNSTNPFSTETSTSATTPRASTVTQHNDSLQTFVNNTTNAYRPTTTSSADKGSSTRNPTTTAGHN